MASTAADDNHGNSYLVWQSVDQIGIYESVGNTLHQRATASLSASNGQTYHYRVTYSSGTITVWRNGTQVVSWTDSTPLTSGNFVAWRTNQSNVSFDNLRITGSPSSYNTTIFMHGDHLGSIGAVTSSGGALLDMTRFMPFGGYRGGDPTFLTERAFTGHKMNNTAANDLGLVYMNARFYSPTLARFISADTLVPDPLNPQQFNRYTYTLNNPVRYTDPTGHCVFGLPCPQPVRDAINTVNDFLVGAEAEFAYNNTLRLVTDLAPTPGESTAMTVGRIVGDLVTTVQGLSEMGTGATMMGGGVAICLTGVGCVATPVVEAAGAVVLAHGAGVTVSSASGLGENIVTMASKGSGGSGPNFRRLSSGEIKMLQDAGYDPHDLKPSKHGSRFDIFKDENGDLYVLPKNGSGPGDPLGININDLGG